MTKNEKIFLDLYNANSEEELDMVLTNHAKLFDNPDNWFQVTIYKQITHSSPLSGNIYHCCPEYIQRGCLQDRQYRTAVILELLIV